jgi:hypothetical protein
MQRLLDQSIRQRRDAERPYPALRLGDVHPAYRLRDVLPVSSAGLDRWPVSLQMILELGNPMPSTPAAPCCRPPAHTRAQVAAFHHGFHQPCLLRFRPQSVADSASALDTATAGFRPVLLRAEPRLIPTHFCLHRLHRDHQRLLASFMFGPSVKPHLLWPLLTSAGPSHTSRCAVAQGHPCRSPRVLRTHLHAYACRIYVARSVQVPGFDDIGRLTPLRRLVSASCSSGQRFAFGFLQIRSHPRHPCRSANTSPCRACRGLPPPSECALPGAPPKKTCLLMAGFSIWGQAPIIPY